MSKNLDDWIDEGEYIIRDAAFSTKNLGDAFLWMKDAIGELTHALDDMAFELCIERCEADQQAVDDIIKSE